ncbi:MAG: histidine phosphatase family protein [Terricaulis sp.]
MPRVYMIRHGSPASTWGDNANADPGLDDKGHAQAREAAKALLALPQPPRFVISSPLARCRETAAPFADTLKTAPRIEHNVAEIPTPSGISLEARPAWLRNAFTQNWSDVEGDINYARWRDQVAATVAASADTAVFSHFVAINAAVSAATNDARVLCFQPGHCSITVFDTDGKALTLIERGAEAQTKIVV